MKFSIVLAFLIFLPILAYSAPNENEMPTQAYRITLDPVKREDCDAFKKSMPPEIESGSIDVPFDWQMPGSQKVGKVFYYGRWSGPGLNRQKAPIIVFNGGPLSSSWSTWEIMKNRLLASDLRFVFFDQRGTGCSNFLPNMSEVSDYLTLRNFRGESIVSDAEAIRKNIFNTDNVTAFGHSFGSKLVLRYVAQYPESLHKVLFSGDSFASSATEEELQDDENFLLSKESIYKKFLDAYPQNRHRLQVLHDLLRDDLCVTDTSGMVRVCGFDIIRESSHFLEQANFAIYDKGFQELLSGDRINWPSFLNFLNKFHVLYLINPVAEVISSYDYRVTILHSVYEKMHENGHFQDPLLLLRPANNKWKNFETRIFGSEENILRMEQSEAGLQRNPNLRVLNYSGTSDGLAGSTPQNVGVGVNENLRLFDQRLDTKFYDGGHSEVFEVEDFWRDLLQ